MKTAYKNLKLGQTTCSEMRDNGYPQHKEIRQVVAQKWIETKDMRKVFEAGLQKALLI